MFVTKQHCYNEPENTNPKWNTIYKRKILNVSPHLIKFLSFLPPPPTPRPQSAATATTQTTIILTVEKCCRKEAETRTATKLNHIIRKTSVNEQTKKQKSPKQ